MQYSVWLMRARMRELANYLVASDRRPTKSCRTNNKYVRPAKLLVMNCDLLMLLEEFRSDNPAREGGGAPLLYSHVLYFADDAAVLCLVEAAPLYDTNLKRTVRLHSSLF